MWPTWSKIAREYFSYPHCFRWHGHLLELFPLRGLIYVYHKLSSVLRAFTYTELRIPS